MSHRTNPLAKSADFINREGFEWLMSPFKQFRYYRQKYPAYEAYPYYLARLLLTLAATVISVLPALYVLTRLAVVADARSNPAKFIPMILLYSMIPVVGLLFGKIVSSAAVLAGTTFAFMPGLVPLPFVVAGGLAIAMAFLLYGVKLLAQQFNFYFVTNGLSTSSKHVYPQIRGCEPNKSLKILYENSLRKQETLKKQLAEQPHLLSISGDGQIAGKTPTTHLESAKDTVELGKTMLAEMEKMIGKHHEGEEVEAEFIELFANNSQTSGHFFLWKNALSTVAKDLSFEQEMDEKAKITLNQSTRQLSIAV